MHYYGLIGTKIGMTRIFTPEGTSVPITIIHIKENRVTQIKNIKKDNYNAIQITSGFKKPNKINKPELGKFLKTKVKTGKKLWEFKIKNSNKICEKIHVGQILNIDYFLNIKKVDIRSQSKGKGFAGTVKRWNFHTQDASHGNSLSHRAPGSIGQNQTPGKVFKGKKMAGHLGNERVTIKNLDIIRVDLEKQTILIKGSIPGSRGSDIFITPIISE